MKNIIKFNSNWFERIKVKISNDEKRIIENGKKDDQIHEIWENFRKNSFRLASEDDIIISQKICDIYLPFDCELICCSVMLPSGRGFIIYKQGNINKHIRF